MQERGEMLGQGATAEVFGFGDGYVVKLVKPPLIHIIPSLCQPPTHCELCEGNEV